MVSLVSCYQTNPGPAHWQAINRITCHLHSTADSVLCYQGGDLKLREYSNVDWGCGTDKFRLTLGFFITIGEGSISWCSHKKITYCITRSTMEAECVVYSLAAQKAIWVSNFLQNLNLTPIVDDLIETLCDNITAI